MTDSKKQFQRNKPLSNFWSGILTSPEFGLVIVHARSAMIESATGADEMRGANRFINILVDLPNQDEEPVDMPSPKIVHDLGIKRNTPPK